MNDDNLADQVREIAEKMHLHASYSNVLGTEEEYIRFFARQLDELVPVPTMADMSEEERAECKWMQCDAGPHGRRGLIVKVKSWSVYVVDKETGAYSDYTPDLVTARPDLPRFEWNGTDQKVEDVTPAKIGDVIESADDPRIAALPDGSILIDRDDDAVIKWGGEWSGAGYMPNESQGDEFGPWKVLHTGQEADQ